MPLLSGLGTPQEMETFQLKLLFRIIGIGAASGLVYYQDVLYVISDHSSYLYAYHIASQKLEKIALVAHPAENIPKKDKPDFEAITQKGHDLFLFGSGSTANRYRGIKFKPGKNKVAPVDLAPLYQKIQHKLGISPDQLNIEGVVMGSDRYYFFQRGNGSSAKNGIISVNDQENSNGLVFIPLELPKIKQVASTFTDAVLVGNMIYFLATAEDTASTYQDGAVLGSLIGSIDTATMAVTSVQQITDRHKFEGLTLYKQTASTIEFLLCEDADNTVLESDIYHLQLKK